MKRSLAFLLFAVLALTCSVAMAGQKQLTFSAGAGAMAGALDVAEAKGFFEDEGIKAKVNSYAKGKIAFDSFLAGKDDITVCNNLGIVLTDFDISKYKLIATVSYTDNQLKIIGKRSSGITKATDLKGKKIALPEATTSHFYFCKFLVFNGISCDDVELVFMDKKQMPAALANGKIDAFCSHGKTIEAAQKKLKKDWILFQDDSIHRKSVQMVIPARLLSENAKQVKGILKATLKGEAFIKTNTDESVRIIAKAKKYTVEAMDKAVRDETEYYISIKQSLLLTLEIIEQWAIDSNLVERKTPRNYLDFIDFRPLEEVAPERVTLIR